MTEDFLGVDMNEIMKLLLVFLLVFGCSKSESPEEKLQEFVDYRFQTNQSKDKLLSYLTGKLHSAIESMSEEEFGKFIENLKYKKKKFKIVLKKCSDEKCFITYVLSYTQPVPKNPDFEVEVKKIAEMERVEDQWKISNVSNVKSYIEGMKPIDVTP